MAYKRPIYVGLPDPKKKSYLPSVIHKCQSSDSSRSYDMHMMQPAYFGHL